MYTPAGTHVLLEACRKYGNIRRFINVSTDEVYGETSLGKDEGRCCVDHISKNSTEQQADGQQQQQLVSKRPATAMPIAKCGAQAKQPCLPRGWLPAVILTRPCHMCLSTCVGLQESSHLDPTNPYSAAKAGAEMLCKAYLTSYKMPIVITRGNNVYGPHQFPEKMIPKFTILASRGEQLPLHGDGSAIRSYLFVEDVAEAFDCVLHKGQVGEVYNIGTERERTVAQVAADIAKHFNLPTAKIVNVKDRAFNDRLVGTGMDVGMRFADGQRLIQCMWWAWAGASSVLVIEQGEVVQVRISCICISMMRLSPAVDHLQCTARCT